jgi:hypothetical protein
VVLKDKPPGPVACPHCGDVKAERLPVESDHCDYRCPTCGDYRISGTLEHQIDNGIVDPIRCHFRIAADGRRHLER